ncbi:polysaccharide deacetylase family protein [candidate division KSB1 bacterium]|nr:polysaccharide deacetylase family protein [candidate division KSB1 bacterium]
MPEAHAALTGGFPSFVFSKNPRELNSGIPVFCYHVVNEQLFTEDLEFLIRNDYITIDADTMLRHLQGKEKAPERSIVITFDDGAQNLYHVAYPLLKKFNKKAVVFIAPRFHDPVGDFDYHTLTPLSWEQIGEMYESGVFDFQSHTMEHRYIPRWPEFVELAGADPKVISALIGQPLSMEEDFRLSREIIEQKLKKKVFHLAFPKFFGNDEAIKIGRQTGYEGFWWGVLPKRPCNEWGQSPTHIVRLEAQFIRRLPGAGRVSLASILTKRYAGSVVRYRNKLLKKGRD